MLTYKPHMKTVLIAIVYKQSATNVNTVFIIVFELLQKIHVTEQLL